MTTRIGKALFPRLTPFEQRRKVKLAAASIVMVLVLVAVVAWATVSMSTRRISIKSISSGAVLPTQQ
jgi:cell division septal protein FtsQ